MDYKKHYDNLISSRTLLKKKRIIDKKSGGFYAEFKSSEEVAAFIGCSHSNVRHVLSGKQKKAKGFNIYYKEIV